MLSNVQHLNININFMYNVKEKVSVENRSLLVSDSFARDSI